MSRSTSHRIALAALILLGGCRWLSSASDGIPSLTSSTAPTSPASSQSPSFIAPGLVVSDPAHTPVVAWDKDSARVNAQIDNLVATFVDDAKKQNLPATTSKALTIQAAASLRDCLASIVDIDAAWASCTIDPTTIVMVDTVTVQDPTHASVQLRLFPKGATIAVRGATIQAILSRDGARLAAHRLTVK